jgi:hypothetical protein
MIETNVTSPRYPYSKWMGRTLLLTNRKYDFIVCCLGIVSQSEYQDYLRIHGMYNRFNVNIVKFWMSFAISRSNKKPSQFERVAYHFERLFWKVVIIELTVKGSQSYFQQLCRFGFVPPGIQKHFLDMSLFYLRKRHAGRC